MINESIKQRVINFYKTSGKKPIRHTIYSEADNGCCPLGALYFETYKSIPEDTGVNYNYHLQNMRLPSIYFVLGLQDGFDYTGVLIPYQGDRQDGFDTGRAIADEVFNVST